jgi:DNA polymerase-1
MRNTVKFVTHGLHYGRGIPSIAGEYGLPIPEVQEFVENYFKAYPELADLMLEQVRKAEQHEPIINRYGRIRHLPQKITGHEKRVAISFAFASNWADTLSVNTVNLYNRFVREGVWFNSVKMTMSLHDALFFEVREDKVESIAGMIIDELEAPVPEMDNYAFPVKMVGGKRWEDPEGAVLWKGK